MFSFKDYLFDNNFKINIINNDIYIINYTNIDLIESNKIIIISKNKMITFLGENLIIKKMVDQEVLITGEFKNIIMENINV